MKDSGDIAWGGLAFVALAYVLFIALVIAGL